jgi:hypothetical protein
LDARGHFDLHLYLHAYLHLHPYLYLYAHRDPDRYLASRYLHGYAGLHPHLHPQLYGHALLYPDGFDDGDAVPHRFGYAFAYRYFKSLGNTPMRLGKDRDLR